MTLEATFDQVITEIKNRVEWLDTLEIAGRSAATNLIDIQKSFLNTYEGAQFNASFNSISDDRANLSLVLSPDSVRVALAPLLLEIAQAIAVPEVDPIPILRKLRDFMVTNAKTINGAEHTLGVITAGGGNVGDGILNRLSVDEGGFPMESIHGEDRQVLCVRDQNQEEIQQEVFEFRGEESEIDFLKVDGSGVNQEIRSASAKNSEAILRNPSFSAFSGVAPTAATPTVFLTTTDLPGFIVDTPANFEIQIDTIFRSASQGDTIPKAVRFKGNGVMSQILRNNKKPSLSTVVPYYVQIAIFREAAATGNVTITWGSQTQIFPLAGLNDGAWNVLRLDLDKDLYYKNFRVGDLALKVTVDTLAVGTCIVDDIITVPMTFIDGLYYTMVGGLVPFVEDDVFTWTDALGAARAIIQYWLLFRTEWGAVTLPSATGGGETITDP